MKLHVLFCFALLGISHAAPTLPAAMGTVSIPAQEWPIKPGPREVTVYIRYPGAGSKIEGVKPSTGLMLSLHNWGGTGAGGSADPGTLANEYNVVAISVDYLQSGAQASIKDPEPSDSPPSGNTLFPHRILGSRNR